MTAPETPPPSVTQMCGPCFAFRGRGSTDTVYYMTPVYTLIVDSVPFSYTAETAPSIGELVRLVESATSVRVVRSSDRDRIYVGEPAGDEVS